MSNIFEFLSQNHDFIVSVKDFVIKLFELNNAYGELLNDSTPHIDIGKILMQDAIKHEKTIAMLQHNVTPIKPVIHVADVIPQMPAPKPLDPVFERALRLAEARELAQSDNFFFDNCFEDSTSSYTDVDDYTSSSYTDVDDYRSSLSSE
jgi:hypothetical protein